MTIENEVAQTHHWKGSVVFGLISRRIVAAMVVAAGLIGGSAVTAWAGSGYPPCGDACNGQDPASYLIEAPGGPGNYYTCAEDAVTPVVGYQYYSFDYLGRTIELRYSNRCETVWGRITDAHLGDVLYIQTWKADAWITQTIWTWEYDAVEPAWSGMWNDHAVTDRVCYAINEQQVGNANNPCTPGY